MWHLGLEFPPRYQPCPWTESCVKEFPQSLPTLTLDGCPIAVTDSARPVTSTRGIRAMFAGG